MVFSHNHNTIKQFNPLNLDFLNGVAVNHNQKIFISDNCTHCVKVFNYDGNFLRQIGGSSETNFPVAIHINHAGHVVIADNCMKFHILLYTQDGQLVRVAESHIQH